jgi:STE24 endopeptidase
MLLTFIVCLLVLYTYTPTTSGQPAPLWASAAGVGLLCGLNVLASWAGSGLAMRRIAGSGRRGRLTAVRVFAMLKGGVVGFVVADTFALGWPALVHGLVGGSRWLVGVEDVLLLAPAVVMLLTVIAFQHRVELQVRPSLPSLGRYVYLRFRIEIGILLGPWLLWVTASELTDAVFYNSPAQRAADTVATFGMLALLLVFSPALLRVLWPTSPLPAGPLRDRLEAFCRAHRFRFGQILVWHTGRRVANAGVIGPTRLLRYVMMTDCLLEYCTEGEVAAVFAHEVGHVRRHHLSFYILLAALFLCLAATVMDAAAALGLVKPLADIFAFDMSLPQGIVLLVAAAVYWGLVFGFISRRLEQEADLFALRNVEQPQDFATALQKLAALAGPPRIASHWRHFSIPRRVAWLQQVAADPQSAVRFERRLWALRIGVVAVFVALLARLLIVRPGVFGL